MSIERRPQPVPITWREHVTACDDVNETSEWAVAMALSTYMKNETGICWPSIRTIARQTRLTPWTVVKALDRLEALGLLRKRLRTNRSGRASSEYTALIGGREVFRIGRTTDPHRPDNVSGSPGCNSLMNSERNSADVPVEPCPKHPDQVWHECRRCADEYWGNVGDEPVIVTESGGRTWLS